MRRYTRSFIGLMEMNSNGEWGKYKDVLKVIEELKSSGEFHSRMAIRSDLLNRELFNHFATRVIVLTFFLGLSLFGNLNSLLA